MMSDAPKPLPTTVGMSTTHRAARYDSVTEMRFDVEATFGETLGKAMRFILENTESPFTPGDLISLSVSASIIIEKPEKEKE